MIFVLNKDFKTILTLRIDETNKSDTRYFNDIYNGNLETGTSTFKFSTPLNPKTGEAIVGSNYIIYKDDNNKFKLFQIMITEQTSNLTPTLNVYCESAGMDLLYEPFRVRKINPCNIRQFLNTVLSETTWEIGYIDDCLTDVITISDIDSDINIFKLIQQEISKFNCDVEFTTEFKNGRLKKYVNAYKRKGKLYKTRLEVQKNTDEIIKTLDFTNVATALIGRGKDGLKFTDIEIEGIEKPTGQDFVYNIEAFERYNVNGRHLFKFFDYDTESPYELLRKTNEALQTYSKPCAKYDIKADLFSSLSNEDFYKLEEGDTFYITDYNFVPPLFLEARVSEITKSKTNKSNNKVIFSNFKEMKSYISNSKMSGRQIINAINNTNDYSIDATKINIDNTDMVDKINTIVNEQNENSKQIASNKKQISSKAEQTDVDKSIKEVTTKIEKTSNKINLIVTYGEDQSSLELTKEGLEIISNAINLNGLVTFTDLSDKNSKTVINGENIDTTNLRVKGNLITGRINGVDGIKFADGAYITNYDFGVAKGISFSAPDFKFISSDVHFEYGINNINNNWSIDKDGNCRFNGLISGQNNIQLSNGSIYLPQGGGNHVADYLRLGDVIMAGLNSFHFITKSGEKATLYANNLNTMYSISENNISTTNVNDVFDIINSVNVLETENGLRIVDKPTKEIINNNCINVSINEKTKEKDINISVIDTLTVLWKAIQELKEENDYTKKQLKGALHGDTI